MAEGWPKQRRLLGTNVKRLDGPDKATGKAKYSADINRPGLLHAKILRSPHAHAKIKSIDTTAARKAVETFWKDKLRRLVAVYGAINVRTDGDKLIVAFRKEKKATGSPWHIYEYKIVGAGWEVVAEMKPGH